jgi:hypothetical protein
MHLNVGPESSTHNPVSNKNNLELIYIVFSLFEVSTTFIFLALQIHLYELSNR